MNGDGKDLQETIVVDIEPWQQRREPFRELCRELARQRDRYTNGRDTDTDLSAAARSTAAVIQFLLAAVPDAPQMAEVLYALGASLADLDRGLVPPLLKPKPNAHGQNKALILEQTWAVASAVITLMIEEGTALRDAARCVAGEFESRGHPLPGRAGVSAAKASPPGDRLRNWRSRLLERGSDDSVKRTYCDAIVTARKQAEHGSRASMTLLDVLRGDLKGPPETSDIGF